jgi:hypothetical protein
MSSGATFKLLSNDGKQDEMIMATRFLNMRLQNIQSMRSKNPRIKDPTPTLNDIEKTHELFVNAHFKPYVAIGYEYYVVTNPKTQLGSEIIFNIPLYGDFIHDMVFHVTLGAVSASNTGAGNRLIRYVNYPGERLCKKTEISVNGNSLDYYENDVYPFYREFCVQPNKQVGYDRCMGQQVPIETTTVTGGGRGSGLVQKTQIATGPQTPLATQPALDLWIPMLLWFSLDVKLSLVSVAIPHGQRFLKINLCNANELLQHMGTSEDDDAPASNPVPVPEVNTCELYINNIFVNPEIHNIIIKRIGFHLVRVYRTQYHVVNNSSEKILMSNFKWPVETIYMGARPVVNNAPNSTLMLDNWDKYTNVTKTTVASNQLHLNSYSWGAFGNDPAQAVDYTAALTRVDNRATGINFATALGVAGATVLSVAQVNQVLTRNGYLPLAGTFVNANAPTNAEIVAATPSMGSPLVYYNPTPSVESIGVIAHGIDLFKQYPSKFYNQYLPLHYGTDKIKTPTDTGKFMIPFNFYPGSYQPSGHINISRAREFYINYVSNTISPTSSAQFTFIGIAINFLLISDGSAVMRYTT